MILIMRKHKCAYVQRLVTRYLILLIWLTCEKYEYATKMERMYHICDVIVQSERTKTKLPGIEPRPFYANLSKAVGPQS